MTEFDTLPMHPMDKYREYRLVPSVALNLVAAHYCTTCPHESGKPDSILCESTPCPGGIYMNKGDFIALILEGRIDHEQFKTSAHNLRQRFGPRVS